MTLIERLKDLKSPQHVMGNYDYYDRDGCLQRGLYEGQVFTNIPQTYRFTIKQPNKVLLNIGYDQIETLELV